VLIDAVDDAENLQNAESAKGDEGNALIGLFAPDGEAWGTKSSALPIRPRPKTRATNSFMRKASPRMGMGSILMISFRATAGGA